MAKKQYTIERAGQIDFFDNYRIPYKDDASVLVDNTDGVYHGNILEFKLNINNTGKVLFQAIKYLSKMRIKGESVPARILLIDLNATKVYVYNSKDYLDDIQKIYVGAASAGNTDFSSNVMPVAVFDYTDMVDSAAVQKLLINKVSDESEWYVPIDLDENCIVGWAERYYREVPNATKGDFLGDGTGKINVNGEIRDPRHFKGLINPYPEQTNEKFKYLMDCLNDRLNKKDLGAFYTPAPYCEKASELVVKAVERVPEGNDYIILDRCVDEETEYFNGKEWKKIKDYQNGESVLTWYPDGHAKIELPKRYINEPADEPFFHYVSNTLDMCLSGSHNIVYEVAHKVKGSPLRKTPCYKVFEKWNKDSNGFRGRIPLTFSLKENVEIDENMLRVAVMINADGSYRHKLVTIDGSCKNPNNPLNLKHDIYEVRVYKERKIERCRKLLNAANIDFVEEVFPTKNKNLSGVLFRFRFPMNVKHFPKEWIYLSKSLKEVFLDEIMYWDGSVSERVLPSGCYAINRRYSSSKKEDVDIVQMIAHSCGMSTRIREDKRGKNINYQLSLRSNCFSKMTKENNNPRVMHTGTFTQETKERKYCFETNSGYLILRRNNKIFITGNCAGTGNLEASLIGKYDKNGDELISHCVVSTYEYYEYKVLQERIGDKVRNIIPPTEANVIYENGKVSNADAMSKDFIENPLIKQYVDDDKCTIILFENPPYADSSSSTFNDGDKTKQYKTDRKDLFVTEEYKKNMSSLNETRNSSQELSNLFIWSGFHYYLRQDTDSYIVFSPVKYFKSIHLVNNKMLGGFAFNRKYFHATDSVISCMCWSYETSKDEEWKLETYDMDENKNLVKCTDLTIKKVYKTFMDSIPKISDKADIVTNVICKSDGTPDVYTNSKGRQPIYNDNIIGYLQVNAFPIAAINRYLVRCNWGSGISKSQGFHLRKDNYTHMLPLFVAKLYPQDNWYDKDVYFTTSDGGDAYIHDSDFLKSCLIYTCLSNQNKCLSFDGSDGRYYRNELCFDTTNGDTVASVDLAKMTLDADEKALMKLWDDILAEAKRTANYDSRLTYGVYQITKELNTSQKIGSGKSKKTVYDYPILNGYLEALRINLKKYYKSHITEKMFEYELLK